MVNSAKVIRIEKNKDKFVITPGGGLNLLRAINEVTKIRLGEIKGAGMFLNALQSYFEEA